MQFTKAGTVDPEIANIDGNYSDNTKVTATDTEVVNVEVEPKYGLIGTENNYHGIGGIGDVDMFFIGARPERVTAHVFDIKGDLITRQEYILSSSDKASCASDLLQTGRVQIREDAQGRTQAEYAVADRVYSSTYLGTFTPDAVQMDAWGYSVSGGDYTPTEFNKFYYDKTKPAQWYVYIGYYGGEEEGKTQEYLEVVYNGINLTFTCVDICGGVEVRRVRPEDNDEFDYVITQGLKTTQFECNFTGKTPNITKTSGQDPTFTSVNYSTTSVTIEGTTYTAGAKMESSTDISFIAEENGELIMHLTPGYSINVDGTTYTDGGVSDPDGNNNGVLKVMLPSGSHRLTRASGSSAVLYYFGYEI